MRLWRIALFLAIVMPGLVFAITQEKQAYLDLPADIALVGPVKPNGIYPLVIFLPFTTASAETFRRYAQDSVPFESFIAITPQGTAQREDYLPDFMAYVGWYEKRLLLDMAIAHKQWPIDDSAVFIHGFSLGGDLSWALMIRNPKLFKGAIIMGSRCSYPAGAKVLAELKKDNRRMAFLIHQNDAKDRIAGMKEAVRLVKKAGLSYLFTESPGGLHGINSRDEIANAWATVIK